MRIQLASFEETQDFGRIIRSNYGTQPNNVCVGLRNHHAQPAGNNADHKIAFGSAVQHAVADLLYESNTVIRIDDLVANFVFHKLRLPP